MQGDEVAIGAVDMGTPQVAPITLLELYEESQHNRGRVARRHTCGYQREVLLCLFFVPDLGLIYVRRFLTLNLTQGKPTFPPFVKCLKSLPNLHTLKIGWMASFETLPLENALDGVELPQIKTLILPPAAHPLLQHCCDVEDVVCMIRYETAASYGFIKSFESIRDSKIKRLAIPLFTWIHLPRT